VSSYSGSCHCGAVGYVYETDIPRAQWAVRSCQCSFCRGHRARTTSDPNGLVQLIVSDPSRLARYRFALGVTEFLLCKACGVYVAAVSRSPEGSLAAVNVNAMASDDGVAEAQAVTYEGEAAADRRARRAGVWTPVEGDH
jgi:hypothetical protein